MLSGSDRMDSFEVPKWLEATRPPEFRGLERDQVRLLTARQSLVTHGVFADIAASLKPGDLIVFNDSATIPASVAVDDDTIVNFSTSQAGGYLVVEVRAREGHGTKRRHRVSGGHIDMPGGAHIDLLAPYPSDSASRRLWLAVGHFTGSFENYLAEFGEPIRYPHIDDEYSLDSYQTVFAAVPGSAEMPSAGRPFSTRVISELVKSGISLTGITLHTGVSSLELGENPYPEEMEISTVAANAINHAKSNGGRLIAVGTTVVRALESGADPNGTVHAKKAWTDLVIEPDYEPRVIDGMITGWHEPQSTHLDLLTAVGGVALVTEAYQSALDNGYLWHEFGDSLLLLPNR